MQRTVFTSKKQEVSTQATPRIARNFSASESSLDTAADLADIGLQSIQRPQATRERVTCMWPMMDDAVPVAWSIFNDDVSTILETTLEGNAEKKLESLLSLLY
jgi:hypothetical protein